MDDLAFEFFNILLPASKMEDTIGSIKELVGSGDIESEIEDNTLKAELYVANLSQRVIPLNVKILNQISKIIYGKVYSWAGKLKVESRPAIEEMFVRVANDWDMSILDDELKLDVMTYAYHSILKNKPFFDGNEKVARLFTNYLALKYGLNLFTIAPAKKNESEYKKYCNDLKLADNGNLSSIKERVRSVMHVNADGFSSTKLGPSASVRE